MRFSSDAAAEVSVFAWLSLVFRAKQGGGGRADQLLFVCAGICLVNLQLQV